ncbi:Unknown protein sequence [Pseudomonas syringae pv. cilantro]|uniref:Uncharacterized protein n=1 Tax=Pseudomonas syringae pv. cilantro TaxID=81035 RepID=A0A0N0GDL2_PSESX|nr:Unknown protein sequence [Pseudomonas syringae pv. cilantro]
MPLAENSGGRIKGKRLATPGKVSGRLRTDRSGQAHTVDTEAWKA